MAASRAATTGMLLALLLVVGCGGAAKDRVAVSGRVHRGGEALQVEGADIGLGMVKVEFHPIQEDGRLSTNVHTAVASADGSFELAEGGLPPGRYRVCVYQWDPYPQRDRLKGQYNLQNSDLEVTLTDQTSLDIDLAQPNAGLSGGSAGA